MRKGKFECLDLLYRFRSIIPRNELKFMTHELEFKRAGCFKLRPKVHKPVLGSRPVSNLRTSWVQRPCGWLCCVMQPIQQACDSITASSEQFFLSYTAIKLDGNAERKSMDSGILGHRRIVPQHSTAALQPPLRSHCRKLW